MKKLNSITLQNFKIINKEVAIPIEGKHALIWGVNGSGKSSIYWSLYTFLQCSNKDYEKPRKYFDKGDESLHNVFADSAMSSHIRLGFKAFGEEEDLFSLSTSENDTQNEFIKAVNNSSEFITHRLLLNFYNYRHSQKIDLFPIFDRDIFPYFFTSKGNNFNAILNKIRDNLNKETKSNLDNWIKEFNDGLEDLIFSIKRGDASKFYNDFFAYPKEQIDIQIQFEQAIELKVSGSKRELTFPIIRLHSTLKPDGNPEVIVKRPQSFFNEARINAIALAVRFVLMENRPASQNIKLLVLDDLLISLDMQNRLKVINLIIDKYKEDYQIIILSHDKGFYREVLRKIEPDKHNWKIMQFYEPAKPGENPVIEYEDETYLSLANSAYIRKDFESCALYLRKETEEILMRFVDPELNLIWKNKDWISLADFITRTRSKLDTIATNSFARFVNQGITAPELELLKNDLGTDDGTTESKAQLGKLKTYRNRLFDFIISEKSNRANEIYPLIEEINKIKDRVLNPGAHAGESPFFDAEIKDAIDKVKLLKEKLDEIQ